MARIVASAAMNLPRFFSASRYCPGLYRHTALSVALRKPRRAREVRAGHKGSHLRALVSPALFFNNWPRFLSVCCNPVGGSGPNTDVRNTMPDVLWQTLKYYRSGFAF
jgi:hypothetical protein